MAADNIKVDGTLPLGAEILQLRQLLMLVREKAEQIKLQMDHMYVASPADYAMLEARAGCETGEGEALYGLVATNVRANLNVGAVATSLDTFTARISG